ncbi:PLP-dependent aminotransferase family protein [Dickeya zeae]|uniref:aminotransferase-like domain-containing protein n=1 Tax=Dickeya zeae TaxID=204042 RepID=UPI001CF2F377|nr:PLP-dependent aminotransferase family protein [Dickeya zeae]MCA6987845.1 PLP-dependent aminotransferase family protein [Dickeya zeae]
MPDLPRYRQIADHFIQAIQSGTLPVHHRLPSVRSLAQQHGISVTTAMKVLRTLEDEHFALARPKSGFFVANPGRNAITCTPQPAALPVLDEQTELHLSLVGTECRVRLDLANGDNALYPLKKMGRLIRQASYTNPMMLGNDVKGSGYLPLKEEIARRALDYGCHLHPDDILITNGCIEALSLSLRAVTRNGDAVAVQSPCYFVLLQMLRNLELRVVEVGQDARGHVDVAQLESLFSQHQVSAFISLTNINNPLGTSLPDSYKRRIAAAADRHDIALIEDDTFADTAFGEQRPFPLRAFSSNVLLCNGFSKTVGPGIRIGWVSSARWRRKLAALKFTSTMGTSLTPQVALAELLRNGGYDAHLRKLRRELAGQVGRLRQAVQHYFPVGTHISQPQGGYAIWVTLPAGCCSSRELFSRARQEGIGIAPGHIFATDQRYDHCLRLNAGFGWNEDVHQAIQLLARWVQENTSGA